MSETEESIDKSEMIVVGYKTRLREDIDIDSYMPDFEPSKACKKEEAKAKSVEEKRQRYLAVADTLPYLSEFSEVFMLSLTEKQPVVKFSADDDLCVAEQVRQYLVEKRLKAWNETLHGPTKNPVYFVGFDLRKFIKHLGIECSLCGDPLPPGFWIGNTEHRDILEMVLPKEYQAYLDIQTVLKMHEVSFPEGYSTHESPSEDVRITVELLAKLGFSAPAQLMSLVGAM